MIAIDFAKLSQQTYALSHDWNLYLPFHEVLKDELETSILGGNLDSQNDTLVLRCKSMSVPTTQVQTEQVTVYGRTTNVIVSAKANGSISLVFREGEKYELYKFFVAWRELSASSATQAYGEARKKASMNEVGLRASISHSNPAKGQKNDLFNLEYILNGVQPTEVTLSQFNNTIEMMTLNVTLKYDNYYIKNLPLKLREASNKQEKTAHLSSKGKATY